MVTLGDANVVERIADGAREKAHAHGAQQECDGGELAGEQYPDGYGGERDEDERYGHDEQ